ncbi:MAG: alpha/beta fold hydrolase [Mycobacteriaceae bacterium]
MALLTINNIHISVDDTGSGEPVLFIAGSGAAGRSWHLHQVPAFLAAGYRVITFDNRGIAPSSECAQGFTIADLVADTAALIEYLDVGPMRVVGTSMGAHVLQELMLERPELVSQAALLATRGRMDAAREFFALAQRERAMQGAPIPTKYEAMVRVLQNFSPKTINNDRVIQDWIDIFTMWPVVISPGVKAQMNLGVFTNRLSEYQRISTPTLVISFADDLTLPAYLGKEVADAIPRSRYVEVMDAGHYGYLEQPEVVNREILHFFNTKE